MKKFALMSVALLAFTACGGGDDDATEDVAAFTCPEGQSSYQVAETPIQFCYDPAWGEPSVTDVAAEVGVLKVVAFAGYEGGPEVRYQSGDYNVNGGVCMECLNTSQPDDGLMTQMVEQLGLSADKLHVRKGDVGGQMAIRVNNKAAGVLSYYVPFAFEGHHVTVSADNDNAADLDDFVWAVKL